MTTWEILRKFVQIQQSCPVNMGFLHAIKFPGPRDLICLEQGTNCARRPALVCILWLVTASMRPWSRRQRLQDETNKLHANFLFAKSTSNKRYGATCGLSHRSKVNKGRLMD
jgi:hypothetical protein